MDHNYIVCILLFLLYSIAQSRISGSFSKHIRVPLNFSIDVPVDSFSSSSNSIISLSFVDPPQFLKEVKKPPKIVSFIDTENALKLSVQGDKLFVSDGGGCIKCFNVSKNSKKYGTRFGRCWGVTATVQAVGNFVYTSNLHSFAVFQQESMGHWDPISTCSCEMDDPWDMDYKENIVYIADLGKGVKIISVEDPLQPFLYSVCHDTIEAWAITADPTSEREFVYVADTGIGFVALNVTDKMDSFRVSYLKVDGGGRDIAVLKKSGDEPSLIQYDETFVLLRKSNGDVDIIDVTNPMKPLIVSTVLSVGHNGLHGGVFGRDDYLFVTSGCGFAMYDIQNKANPKFSGKAPVETCQFHTIDVFSQGNYVFLGNGIDGVSVSRHGDLKISGNAVDGEVFCGSVILTLTAEDRYDQILTQPVVLDFGVEQCSVKGHGECVQNGCECSESPLYYGDYCEIWNCFGIPSTHTSDVCSGDGDCVRHDTCVCKKGYFGDDCSISKCNGIFSNESKNVCNGHGVCYKERCLCLDRVKYDVTRFCNFQCFGYDHEHEVGCGSRGMCVDSNDCECDPGYYGNQCSGSFYAIGFIVLVVFLLMGVIGFMLYFCVTKVRKKWKGRFKIVKVEKEELEGEIIELEEEKEELEVEKEDLKREIEVVKGEKEELKREIESVKAEKEELKREIREAKGEREELKRKIKVVKGEINVLKKNYETLKGLQKNMIYVDERRNYHGIFGKDTYFTGESRSRDIVVEDIDNKEINDLNTLTKWFSIMHDEDIIEGSSEDDKNSPEVIIRERIGYGVYGVVYLCTYKNKDMSQPIYFVEKFARLERFVEEIEGEMSEEISLEIVKNCEAEFKFGNQSKNRNIAMHISCGGRVDIDLKKCAYKKNGKLYPFLDEFKNDEETCDLWLSGEHGSVFETFSIRMRYHGKNLEDYLRKRRKDQSLNSLGMSEYWRILFGIANGVKHLNDNFIIHMDLHVRNIFVDERCGRVWIGDFGASSRIKKWNSSRCDGKHFLVSRSWAVSKDFPLKFLSTNKSSSIVRGCGCNHRIYNGSLNGEKRERFYDKFVEENTSSDGITDFRLYDFFLLLNCAIEILHGNPDSEAISEDSDVKIEQEIRKNGKGKMLDIVKCLFQKIDGENDTRYCVLLHDLEKLSEYGSVTGIPNFTCICKNREEEEEVEGEGDESEDDEDGDNDGGRKEEEEDGGRKDGERKEEEENGGEEDDEGGRDEDGEENVGNSNDDIKEGSEDMPGDDTGVGKATQEPSFNLFGSISLGKSINTLVEGVRKRREIQIDNKVNALDTKKNQ